MSQEKILTREQAAQRAAELRASGKTLVTVNGSFDLLHAGRLVSLEEAGAQGDVVFVGLNADASVRANKGPSRPIIPERARASLLAALACVSYVVILDEPEAGAAIIELCRPHVHVNGREYGEPEQWVEYPTMQRHGVRGHVCARRPGLATTDILRKIAAEAAAERDSSGLR